MLESSVEKKLTLAVKKAGGLCIKLPAMWYRGIPDRLVLLPVGRFFFVELKQKTGRLSEGQKAFRNFLTRIGFPVHIIYGPDQLKEFFQHVGIS